MAKKMDLSSYKKTTPLKSDSRKAEPVKKNQEINPGQPEPADKRKSPSVSPRRPKDSKRLSPEPLKQSTTKVNESTEAMGIRLNRYIAHCGVCSRREADVLIADGKIRVNKKVITAMGYQVMPGDSVFLGKKLLKKEDYAYVLLNKPKNFITTTKDTHERKTVMDLVEKASDARLYPVGRLDRNTTGLLLLTNDGELTDRLSHPSNNIKKIYQVEIDKPLLKEHFEEIVAGFTLEDGPIAIDEIVVLTADSKSIGIEIHSGRNRIVRRIFEHFDYEVTRLDRVVYAGLTKANLPRGKWRHLNDREIGLLKKKGKKRGS